jgi:hypothetical protein
MIFDNTKIKRLAPAFGAGYIPFARGAEEMMAWHDADLQRRVVDRDFDRLLDRIIADQSG